MVIFLNTCCLDGVLRSSEIAIVCKHFFFISTFQFHKIHLAEYVIAWAVAVKFQFSLSSQSSFILSAGMSEIPLPCVWLREEFWGCHKTLFTGLRGSWDTRSLFYSCFRSLWHLGSLLSHRYISISPPQEIQLKCQMLLRRQYGILFQHFDVFLSM